MAEDSLISADFAVPNVSPDKLMDKLSMPLNLSLHEMTKVMARTATDGMLKCDFKTQNTPHQLHKSVITLAQLKTPQKALFEHIGQHRIEFMRHNSVRGIQIRANRRSLCKGLNIILF